MFQGETPERAVTDYRVTSGANQFYWIAGLSVINLILYVTNASVMFPLGLSTVQLLADLSYGTALASRAMAGIAALAFLGLFVLFGTFARRQQLWAFIAGAALYIVDGILWVVFYGDWISAAVHAFFLYFIIRGLLAVKT